MVVVTKSPYLTAWIRGVAQVRRMLTPRVMSILIAVFAPLVAWAFWIGLNPQPYFRILERPVAQIVERVQPGYYAQHNLPNPLTSPTAQLR